MIILVYSPSYDINNGGSIVLHRLCHILNHIDGCEAYLVKHSSKKRSFASLRDIVKTLSSDAEKPTSKKYKTNISWKTPIWNKYKYPSDSVVIYPETVDNNPLEIKNVVRWLLHQPGFHTQKINYSEGELYFKFNSAIDEFNYPGSVLSKNEMKVIYYPIDIYNTVNCNDKIERDIVSCHMIRKGNNKKFIHNEQSVPLDGLEHREIADIFRRSKRFICYDDYTAYSIFAVLSGCESIVIPDEKTSIDDWYPNLEDRYGIAYGLSEEQREWALKTKHKVLEHVISEHNKSQRNVENCLNEIIQYFNLK
ncbi:WavQ [Brenneria corticis]|uniref:WavQ n=1 Tax=Brenneria corticis TaxID=2173106 RepID=A0A2U1UDF6_9GAMM|nr:WavQ [Brenneria sp. CFCC 11842]PWC19703.1 WavQ [Brenneria sp. CFCC 11842]